MKQVRQFVSMTKGALGPLFLSPHSRQNVGAVLDRQARKRPHQPLFLFEGRTVSYLQANELANRYARLFLSRGFRKGKTGDRLFMLDVPQSLVR